MTASDNVSGGREIETEKGREREREREREAETQGERKREKRRAEYNGIEESCAVKRREEKTKVDEVIIVITMNGTTCVSRMTFYYHRIQVYMQIIAEFKYK